MKEFKQLKSVESMLLGLRGDLEAESQLATDSNEAAAINSALEDVASMLERIGQQLEQARSAQGDDTNGLG